MNEQEEFWKGEFGQEYMLRNNYDHIPNRIGHWVKMLAKLPYFPQSIIELGCNIGINLHALNTLFPHTKLYGVEINPNAVQKARDTLAQRAEIYEASLLNYEVKEKCELSFTSGVLIHIAPEFLPQAYDTLYSSSSRFICIKEYYNPKPVEVDYRGHSDKLFKRDFCGEIMDRFKDLKLIDYGFIYRRDPLFPADDATWFLLEKIK